ncbi:MAG TPA: HD domain-containing phosphohydrolase, partial [Planctomycetaceae bacterium]
MRILVADDDAIIRTLIEFTLINSGYEVQTAADGLEAFEHLRTGRFRMVISDWEMPGLDGVELCRRIRGRHCGGYVYVILLTSRNRTEDIVAGLAAGADDFITKPFEPAELCMRLRVGQRLLSLESRNLTIFALAKLADSRDQETGKHLERIREYCRVLAQDLSGQEKFRDQVDGEYVDAIYLTSPLHDIGKVGIPDGVLRKPGRLDPSEYEIMKRHAEIGAETLDSARAQYPEARFLEMARDIALTHHERYDGKGYPAGLKGDRIPLCGRIVALADAYDALTSKRVYKPACTHEHARAVIVSERGRHFDPDVVDAFLRNEALFVAVQQAFAEAEKPADGPERSLPLATPAGVA